MVFNEPCFYQGYGGRRNFLSKLKNREEFEGGLEKGKEKRGKEEKSDTR